MPQQAFLDVFGFERLSQKRVLLKINHAEHQIDARLPNIVKFAQLVGAQRRALNG